MSRRFGPWLLASLLLMLTACGQPAPPTEPDPTATVVPTLTVALPTDTPQPTETPTAPQADAVNVVDAAGLRDTVRLEIVSQRSLGAGPPPEPLIVAEPGLLHAIVTQLDEELPLRDPVRCPSLYTLRFIQPNGEAVEFGYACAEGPIVLRGEQEFFGGKEVHPSLEFDELIAARFAPPTIAVNVVALAGLDRAQRIHVSELVHGDDGWAYEERTVIDDPEVVRAIVAALAGERELLPPADCRAYYELRFVTADGAESVFGYSCGADGGGFLRGTQEFFEGQDAAVPPEFDRLLMDSLG